MKCWYCHKKITGGYHLIVTINGERRPVCRDDRNCRPGMGIKGWGAKPHQKHNGKNKVLQRNKQRNEEGSG